MLCKIEVVQLEVVMINYELVLESVLISEAPIKRIQI